MARSGPRIAAEVLWERLREEAVTIPGWELARVEIAAGGRRIRVVLDDASAVELGAPDGAYVFEWRRAAVDGA